MKEINKKTKNNFIKKIFIKFCRALGFEIIDQSNFYVPTQQKHLNEDLNIPGKKSITVPLGETKISRKVKALSIIFRSCTDINMLTQNKSRIFDKNKCEYTFRSLNSIIFSTKEAKKKFPEVNFNFFVIDHNSKKSDLDYIQKKLSNSGFQNSVISLNVDEFKKNIKKINEKNQNVTDNEMSNMSNIHKSLLIAKDKCEDLIYFVEDDYIHQRNAIEEMIYA